jgi:hypothetical protein
VAKMKNLKLNKKTYTLAFIVVTILNVVLAGFLLRTVLAQTDNKTYKNQPSIVAVSAKQNDSPLLITVVNVDNSNPRYQIVNFTIQNITNKPIRGYVILGGSGSSGKVITNFLPAKSFQPSAIVTEELLIERENIKSDKPFSLSVDYVEFENGNFWGEDSEGQSEQIAGGRAGAEAAADQFINLIDKRETATMDETMKKPLSEVEVRIPETFKDKNEKWQNGFSNGYKGIISFLKNQREKSDDETLKKLREIRKNLQVKNGEKQ